jgi:cytochrome c553
VLGIVCFVLGATLQRQYDLVRLMMAPFGGTDDTAIDIAAIDLEREPIWAYGFDTAPTPEDRAIPQNPPSRALRPNEDPQEQTRIRRLEGSDGAYSVVDVRDQQNVVDWFPDDHPPMPDVVKQGPAAMGNLKRGCGYCHLPNGKGRPENAPLAGLPAQYFIRQIQDFRNGLRHSADPRKPNTFTMIDLAKGMTDEEVRAAADYFSSIQFTPWIRVVETDMVPMTRIVNNLFLAEGTEKTEPLGMRILEVPEDTEQAEMYRNPRSGFIAYVPIGATKLGEDLVTTGGARIVNNQFVQGKTMPCVTCHGLDLMGVADVPPIVGRSPSYVVRQMWDIQQGTRKAEAAQLMKLAIAKLTPEDMIGIAAYVASLTPGNPAPIQQSRLYNVDHGTRLGK